MKILVTGGAGFIGTHLIKKLFSEGHQIWCIDSLISGSKKNIEQFCHKIILGDICDKKYFYDIPQLDQVYHLACPASPPKYQENPLHTISTCVDGTRNVLEYARRVGASVLFSSTSEIYGEPLVHPQREDYRGNVNTLGIRACYDEGKRIAETICMEYHRLFSIDIKIVRIFNTYGPYMSPEDGRVISNFCIQALKGDDITIYGDGSQTRSLCYVEDLVEGLISMINSKELGPINLGNDKEYSIKDIAYSINNITNNKSKIVYKLLPTDDPTRRKPDIELAKEKLNWTPKIDFEEGIIRTLNYFKSL